MNDDLNSKVSSLIDLIRPNLQMDGGDIEFLGLDDKKVKVRLTGACAHCPSANYTLQLGVEAFIKERIPEIESVVNIA